VLGVDGYIGWSLAMHLALSGHKISGIDNFSRRKNVKSVGSHSALPILSIEKRIKKFKEIHDKHISFYKGDILNYRFISDVVKKIQPESIVHLGEQPSAPFSMKSWKNSIYTQRNNVEGTLNVLHAMKNTTPKCHLVKLGTMGEYGTPNIDIPEGFIEIKYHGRKDVLPFPKTPGSLYHVTKVHDTTTIDFACRIWGLRSTDIMQGVVYGTRTSEIIDDSLFTRFDFDETFGTVINRFCAEAIINYPLSPYGKGCQTRGFIALIDSIQCLALAVENPPKFGEYRVFNQLDEVFSIMQLARHVKKIARKHGLDVKIKNVPNPRIEREIHHYKVEYRHLKKLGFKPSMKIDDTIDIMLQDLLKHKNRILAKKRVLAPKTKWN